MIPTSSALVEIFKLLEGLYGPQSAAGPTDPYQMILYLNCGYPATDASCSKGFASLEGNVGLTPERILAAPKAKLARLMRSGGIVPDVRAGRLKEIAKRVRNEFGGNLRSALKKHIEQDKVASGSGLKGAKKALQAFPTVGEPSADKILLFAKLAPVAAVPSASLDVPTRIFVGRPVKNYPADYRAARQILDSALKNEFVPRQRAYLLLKKHGQEICKRSNPKCAICPLTSHCAYLQAQAADSNLQ
jgi:endonuclease III